MRVRIIQGGEIDEGGGKGLAGACLEVRVGLGDQGRAGHLWKQEGTCARGWGGVAVLTFFF